jgi:hypothetical protein
MTRLLPVLCLREEECGAAPESAVAVATDVGGSIMMMIRRNPPASAAAARTMC